MKMMINLDEETLTSVVVSELTFCYQKASESGDDLMSQSVEKLLKEWFLSPTEWVKWKEENKEQL